MILQLNPPIPIVTPKGKGLAHFLIDEGIEHDLKWVCFLDRNGECWTYTNPEIRAQKNITHGREHISPFYHPDVVSINKNTWGIVNTKCTCGIQKAYTGEFFCECAKCKIDKEENL